MDPRTLRVATWNVRGLRGGVPAVAAALRAEAVDVVLLQESGSRRRLQELGRELGWTLVADPPAFPRRRIPNAIAARPEIGTVIRSHLVRFAGSPMLHPRGALAAELDGWSVWSAHLGLRGPERGRHVAELLSLFEGRHAPDVLGADLNVHPGRQSHVALASALTDVWEVAGDGEGATFPSDEPTTRIDFLFVGREVHALRAWTAGGTVSDHLMVVADLRFA